MGGRNWEYNLADQDDTLGIPTAWTAPENLLELSFAFNLAYKSHDVFSNFALVVRSSGIRPGLSPEDEEVKQKLAKCRPRVYSKLIRLDIPEPSSVSPPRGLASRPFLPFIMRTSHEGPSVVKPTQEELQARVESLAKKKRSIKRKAQAPSESSLGTRGKVPRLGVPSPPSTAKGWGSSD